ncbi:outer membrane protein insertion porin family [Dysgonomonadaceae bacterium PH5-43]|nr:outer membrane protein insertion porin family [Dysgonomonadaceae bacterium PH5-43]
MYKNFLLFCLLSFVSFNLFAQEETAQTSQEKLPVVTYSMNSNYKKYTIADIKISGVENYGYEDYVLIGISGLSIGDKISVPGEELTNALKAYLKQGLFSWGKILINKQTNDSVWIEIALTPNPLISSIEFSGVKKSEREDLEGKIGLSKNSQLTPNIINRVKKRVKDYFGEKGFSNAEVTIQQRDDLSNEGKVILDIAVNKNAKTKVKNIYIIGNEELSDYDLKMAMKKTNEGFSLRKNAKLSLRKLFSSKKFVKDEFSNDLQFIVDKYNEKGYRNAQIVSDSLVTVDDGKKVDVYITVHEGEQFHVRNINWIGNTKYSSTVLGDVLGMQPGDVYDMNKLNNRLFVEEDAVVNLYMNSGYMFSDLEPVEVNIENDSIDVEIRIQEGVQATINRVSISGNDRIYEDIIRRELFTKPGQLFNKELIMMSWRELAQMGHFDAENVNIDTNPDVEAGTVDITFDLTPKANDQIEFSAGYGQTGLIGRLSLKFSNFSMKNLFNPSSYKGFLPQGEGQTLTLSGQTNGRYYQSYSVSFFEPWLGGKRPNSLSLSAYYMIQTGIDSRSYNNSYFNNSYYYDNYGYGYDYAYDDNQSMKIFGVSAGYGKRLSWPDIYFNLMAEVTYQRYMMKNWNYFIVENGNANSLSLGLTLSRNSTDNQLYPRSGSTFSLSVSATPPYSLWDGVDYANLSKTDPEMFKWVEYHKWKFKGRLFIPLANREKVKKTPVLMSRIELGFLGSYNSDKYNPFETFYVGGDGMSGYSTLYANEMIGLRGYEGGALTPYQDGYAYSRFGLEFRYPLMLQPSSTIYALAFVEAGNAWSKLNEFNPFDLKRSAGIGARVFLPMIGLLGVDWAYGFDSPYPGTARSGSRMHFILGQEF